MSRASDETETGSNSSDGSQVCPICLNKLCGQEIGTPENCDHSFCLECLLEWSKNINTCPIDRIQFSLIIVCVQFGEKISRWFPVENILHKDGNQKQQVKDYTCCETCGLANCEDRFLTCGFGYHCGCLASPLRDSLMKEWFCPYFLPTVESSHRSSIQESLLQEILDNFQVMLSNNFKSDATVLRRATFPKIDSKNVNTYIQRRKIKGESAGKRKEVSRTKIKRPSLALCRLLAALLAVKKKMADDHRLMKPPLGHTLSITRHLGIPQRVNSLDSGTGISLISLYGDRNELDIVNESFDSEGDVSLVRTCIRSPVRAHAKEVLVSLFVSSRSCIPTVPSLESHQNYDMIDSILQIQPSLNYDSQVMWNRSLKSTNYSMTLKAPNSSIQKRPQDPVSQGTSSKETSPQGYSKCRSTNQEDFSGSSKENVSIYNRCMPSRTSYSKENVSNSNVSRPTDGHCSSSHSHHHHKGKHKHSHRKEKKHPHIEEDVDIYSDIESLGESALLIEEDNTNNHFSLPSSTTYHSNSLIGNLEEGSDSSENELVIDEDAKVGEEQSYSDGENAHTNHSAEIVLSGKFKDEETIEENLLQEIVEKDNVEEFSESFPCSSSSNDNCKESENQEAFTNYKKEQYKEQNYKECKQDKKGYVLEQNLYICKVGKRETGYDAEQISCLDAIEEPVDVNINEDGRDAEYQFQSEEKEDIEVEVGADIDQTEDEEDCEQQQDEETGDIGETKIIEFDDIQEQNYDEEDAIYINGAENMEHNGVQKQRDKEERLREIDETEYTESDDFQEYVDAKGRATNLDEIENVMDDDVEDHEDENEERITNINTEDNTIQEYNIENENNHKESELYIENMEGSDMRETSSQGLGEMMWNNEKKLHGTRISLSTEEPQKTPLILEKQKGEKDEVIREAKENMVKQKTCMHYEQQQLGDSNNNVEFSHEISLNLAEVEDISEDENEMVCQGDSVNNEENRNIDISCNEQDDVEKKVALLFADEEKCNIVGNKKQESKSRKKNKNSYKASQTNIDDEAEEGEIVENVHSKKRRERERYSSRHNLQEEYDDLTDLTPRINISDLPRIPKIKKVEVEPSLEQTIGTKRTSVLERIDAGSSEISWKKLSKNTKDRNYRDRKPKDENILYQREIKVNKERNKSYKPDSDRWKQDGWSREGNKYQKSDLDQWKQDSRSKEGTKNQQTDFTHLRNDDKYKRIGGSNRGKDQLEVDLWKEKNNVEIPDHNRFSNEKKVEREMEKSFDKSNERREWRVDKSNEKKCEKREKNYRDRYKNKDYKEESNRSNEKEKYRRHSHEHSSEKTREHDSRKEEKTKICGEKYEGHKEKFDKQEKKHHDKNRHHDHKKKKDRGSSPYSDITSLDAKEIYAKGDSIIINVNFNRNTLKDSDVAGHIDDAAENQIDNRFQKSKSLTGDSTNKKNRSYGDFLDLNSECPSLKSNIFEESFAKQSSENVDYGEAISEHTPKEIPLDEDFQLEKDTIMSDDGLKLENFDFENRNYSESEAEDDFRKKLERNVDSKVESNGKEEIYLPSYSEPKSHFKNKNPSRRHFPRSPSPPSPPDNDSYDPCEPTCSPNLRQDVFCQATSTDISSVHEGRPVPPPSPELPPLPTEPEPEEPPLPDVPLTCYSFHVSEPNMSVSTAVSTALSALATMSHEISHSSAFGGPQRTTLILPNLRVPPPNFVHQSYQRNLSSGNRTHLNSGSLPLPNQNLGAAPPHVMFTASNLQNVIQRGMFSTQPPPSLSSVNMPGSSQLGALLPPSTALGAFSQIRSQNLGTEASSSSNPILTNIPPLSIGLPPQMSLPNLRQPPPPLPASVQSQIFPLSQTAVSMAQTTPLSSVNSTVTRNVSSSQVITKQQLQEDVTDVVDMDVESPYSPYSPGDSLVLEIEEEEKPAVSVFQKNYVSVPKDSFDSLLSSEKLTSSLNKRNYDSSKDKSRKPKNGDHHNFQSVDSRLSSESYSKQETSGHSSKKQKIDSRPEANKHKHLIRFEVIDRSKLSASVASKKQTEKKGVLIKMDDSQLKILDELPSSAMEMQVKEKFLKKLNRQERVVEEVKLAVKPYYNKKEITKDEYKEILRKSVPKVCHNESGEINPVKIKALVEGYVKKFKHQRKKSMSGAKHGK
ncbi:ankyrin repeat domain-containing protein 11-like [Limulus polyphemus]|uniref:Ankyrin repeat domain-containing protein 11-like n=1 Tax=Limulus polyphemus TaxID=6850 RepID=A0ABM1C5E6_LIMPO|nr:ankyrin repeat domain-containing protein 11-like [Limulus polyphemus]